MYLIATKIMFICKQKEYEYVWSSAMNENELWDSRQLDSFR